MKTLEQRVEALEKQMKKVLDSVKRLIENKTQMTVSEAGRKGGAVTGTKKGPASLSPERRAEILANARAAKAAKRGNAVVTEKQG